jgi:hypothetical protein
MMRLKSFSSKRFHFYEVETKDGITFLLISRRTISNVKTIQHVVQLTEFGILEAQ